MRKSEFVNTFRANCCWLTRAVPSSARSVLREYQRGRVGRQLGSKLALGDAEEFVIAYQKSGRVEDDLQVDCLREASRKPVLFARPASDLR